MRVQNFIWNVSMKKTANHAFPGKFSIVMSKCGARFYPSQKPYPLAYVKLADSIIRRTIMLKRMQYSCFESIVCVDRPGYEAGIVSVPFPVNWFSMNSRISSQGQSNKRRFIDSDWLHTLWMPAITKLKLDIRDQPKVLISLYEIILFHSKILNHLFI